MESNATSRATTSSRAQRRLWFLPQLQPDANASYNIGTAVRLHGPLRRVRLQQALDHVVARHESFRTGVALVEGEVRQVVAPTAFIPLSLVDWGATLLRFATDDHVLLLTPHHLVADRWSLRLMLDELATAYRAALAGETADLPALAVQYADYPSWRDERAADGEFDSAIAHLTAGLVGLEPLDLPIDLTRPAVRTADGAVRHAKLDAAVTAAAVTRQPFCASQMGVSAGAAAEVCGRTGGGGRSPRRRAGGSAAVDRRRRAVTWGSHAARPAPVWRIGRPRR